MSEDAREIFKAYEDENGWITKQPDEIAEEWEEDSVRRIDLEKDLWGHYYLRDTKLQNEDNELGPWRFIN